MIPFEHVEYGDYNIKQYQTETEYREHNQK